MEYIRGTTEFHITEPTVISFGKFDGLHRGHELLMDYMIEKRKAGLKTVVFTFDIPPGKLIYQNEGKVITTNEEKMHVFERIGVDYLVECPFVPEIMCMKPENFIHKIVTEMSVRCMVAGRDFHFGHNREGNFHTLERYAKELSYEVAIMEKIQYEGRDISSTFVREEIANGNIGKANHLLGYAFFVQGEVIHGNHMGGPVLGFPTVNLLPPQEKLLPPNGVYITETTLEGKVYQGISNVGCKPTIEGENPVGVETHIFDFNRNVYGRNVKVEFLKRVRPELKFASIGELTMQMQEDIAYARKFFECN